MPLRDHFHGWLKKRLEWHSFHNSWATTMAYALNTYLPEGFWACANQQKAIEIDVAAYSDADARAPAGDMVAAWQPSPGVETLPFELAGEAIEVLVHGDLDGRYLAAAIELVSEGNKDRPESRESFITKCESYLKNGAGLIIFDAVTTRTANLHDELMARVGRPDRAAWGERLYATAYSPRGKNGSAQLTAWREKLTLGLPLPTMPLWLFRGPVVPVHLEATYEDTFRGLRLPTEEPK
jgi:hypothetical protein